MYTKYEIVPFCPYHIVRTVLSNTILSVYHFVHTILSVPFCLLPFCPVTLFSIMSEFSGQHDGVVVGHSLVPGSRERFDQLAFDRRTFLDHLQGYFTPEILNW